MRNSRAVYGMDLVPVFALAVMLLLTSGLGAQEGNSESQAGRLEGMWRLQITVRDCLRHTNGLASDQKNVGSLAETAEHLAKSKLKFDPGSKWQYGPGLSVAGRVVLRVEDLDATRTRAETAAHAS